LFRKEKAGANSKLIDTIIGSKTSMSGELFTKGIVRIDGHFKGDVFTESDFIVGENANVEGNIKCMNAAVAGKLQGNIEAEAKLEIFKSGIIMGDIKVGNLMVEEGAIFTGKCLMGGREIEDTEEAKKNHLHHKIKEEQAEEKSEDNNKVLPKGKQKNSTININRQAVNK